MVEKNFNKDKRDKERLKMRELKCDLCNGDPACVKGCPFKALGYEKPQYGAYYRRLESALTLGRKELREV